MAHEVAMPRLGWSAEDGSLVEWLKRDGDAVEVGDIICTVESDKSIMEVESLDRGTLRIPADSPKPGTRVPVGTVLAYLVEPGEPAPFEVDSSLTPPSRAPLSISKGNGEGTGVRLVRRRDEPAISPRARRIAAELGVDWSALRGTGRTGRIVERDVRLAVAASAAAPPRRMPDLSERSPSEPALPVRRPLRGVRQLTAQRMAESAHAVASVTLTTDADATDLIRVRDRLKSGRAAAGLTGPTYDDVFAKLIACAVREHPAMNASLVDGAVVEHPVVNVGIAVDTERGLLVPVVRGVDGKSIEQISEESARLIASARAGTIAPDDLRGGTFTITNLGMYDVDAFTPIVNLPECAILGIGRIIARPVVVDEQTERVAVRKMLTLSLTFDHRVVDGAPAARFLKLVRQYVEQPEKWLGGSGGMV